MIRNASQLRQRIQLKRYRVLQGAGRTLEKYPCAFEVDGLIQKLDGDDLAKAKEVHPRANVLITIRRHEEVAPRWRAVYRMVAFNVLVVKGNPNVELLNLYCHEV